MNGERAYELLKRIGFERVSGRPEELEAARILLKEVEDIGVSGHLESFGVPDAVVSKATFEVLAPYRKSYEVVGYLRSASTRETGEELDFLYVEDARPANLIDAKGKFVLINGRLIYDTYERLMKAGVAGILTFDGALTDDREKSDVDVRKLRETLTDVFGATVAVHMRVADAMEIVLKKASRIRVCVKNENIEGTSHNVCAEITGTKYPQEIISFGAHFDSLVYSSGVYDNGSGSVILMELLRHFKKNPPARTLKFMWYGSEEQGLLGSKAYVKAHEGELARHKLMINVDVAGPILGQEFCSVTGNKSLTEYTEAMMKEVGYPVEVKQDIYSSDSIPFADRGIPGVNFGRSGAPGAAFIHCRHDTLRFISPDALASTARIVCYFAERVINAAILPFVREMPEEMVEKVNKYLKKKNPVEKR